MSVYEAEQERKMVVSISHELRTPLSGLAGLNQLMRKNSGNKEKMDELLAKSEETTQFLLTLVNHILDYSKLQSGNFEPEEKLIAVDQMIDHIWRMQVDSIQEKGIAFQIKKDISCPRIIGDEVKIKQVIMNLLGNACKYTLPGGHITFSFVQNREKKNRVINIIRVEDDGIGMTEEFQKTIFEPYAQEKNELSDKCTGTGLGLAICDKLVEAMGGSICVESKLGAGSTFTVILPTGIAEKEKRGRKKKYNVLLAEDNELNARILSEMLADEGMKVTVVTNGEEAVEKFEASRPGLYDVVLMDMHMPKLDGCAAAKRIRSLPRPDAAKVKIFACTASMYHEERVQAKEAGMDDYLTLPVNVSLMKQKMNG